MSQVPHILVIDDDADIRLITEMALRELEGWRVTTANGGPEGLEILKHQSVDLVLLDMMMPEWDGLETLSRIRELPDRESLKVLFLTARVQDADRGRYTTVPVDGVIEKPFDVTAIGRLIRQHLNTAL